MLNSTIRAVSAVRTGAFLFVLALAFGQTAHAQLAGTYTIGGASPNYPTFTAAVAALAGGVTGPVTFRVRPGTYTEQISLNTIPGTSQTNTVTFQSENGVNTSVILTFAGTVSNNYVVQLNGASWVRFRNMTVSNTNATYGMVFRFNTVTASTNNIIEGNIIQGPVTTSSSADLSLVWGQTVSHINNTIRNNTMLNGSNAVFFSGTGTNRHANLMIEGNTMTNQSQSGVWLNVVDNPTMRRNVINMSTTATITQYGLYLNTLYLGYAIDKNRISLLGASGAKRGIQFWNSSIIPMGLITNNFVTVNGGASTSYCFYVSTSGGKKLYNNTMVMLGTSTSSRTVWINLPRAEGIEQLNNIYVNQGPGHAFYGQSLTARIFVSDYNVYYGTGAATLFWDVAVPNLAAMQAQNGMDRNSIFQPVTFANTSIGDLHLAGASQNDMALTGQILSVVPDDIDGDARVVPYRGADEACFLLPTWVDHSMTDQLGQEVSFLESPGQVNLAYTVSQPAEPGTVTITVNFYSVTNNQLAYSETFSVQKLNGIPLTGNRVISLPGTLPYGYYRAQVVFNTLNSCGFNINYTSPKEYSFLVVAPGTTPCVVWPGDVNNDGIVNYGDRSALNKYIFNANLRPSWLTGPARYRADAATNPMTYLTWVPQASAPWQTPEGCYMDADGNGVVNTYDMLGIKVNFLRTHGAWAPKQDEGTVPEAFMLEQNYPNPFNPSTVIRFRVPEQSQVRLVVHDVFGREIATLIDGVLEAGAHSVTFSAEQLSSGRYPATITATGRESGATWSRTIMMTLGK